VDCRYLRGICAGFHWRPGQLGRCIYPEHGESDERLLGFAIGGHGAAAACGRRLGLSTSHGGDECACWRGLWVCLLGEGSIEARRAAWLEIWQSAEVEIGRCHCMRCFSGS